MKLIKMTLLTFSLSSSLFSTGGFDNGSAVGKGNLQLDFTLNPADIVPYGQSYVTWNYGLSETIDFHGYASHEAKGVNQLYYGIKYTFFQNPLWDIATALGIRQHESSGAYLYLPQLLYTYKLPKGYDIGGSVVSVYHLKESNFYGITSDITFRIPIKLPWVEEHVESTKLAIGVFRNATGGLYPTYSIDVKF
jgi:hypothetical protein